MILKNGKRLDGCSDTLPIGTIQPFLGLTPPNGYLACLGQLISKAEYPELYIICGDLFGQSTETHFYLPDLRGKTVVGYDENDTLLNVMGKILGSKTHKHSIAGHAHDIDGHTHTSAAHTHDVAGHTHTSAAHVHSTGNHTLTVAEMPAHSHAMYGGANTGGSYEGTDSFASGFSTFRKIEQGTYDTGGSGAHNHGNTGSTTPGNTGSTSLTTKSTTPGATGSTSLTTKSSGDSNTGDADNFQPSIAMNWIVKAAMLIPEYFRVENILSSSSTSNALSAAQGKVLFDKIENNATYNLEERIIGTWINGKPLYRKTILLENVTLPVNGDGTIYETILMDLSNIDHIDLSKFHARVGYEQSTSYITTVMQNTTFDNGDYFYIRGFNNNLLIQTDYFKHIFKACVTIEYTKTTD